MITEVDMYEESEQSVLLLSADSGLHRSLFQVSSTLPVGRNVSFVYKILVFVVFLFVIFMEIDN